MTEFNLNESLFNEEAPHEMNKMIGRPTKKANLNKVSTHNQTGLDDNGRIPLEEAWLLLKLYEATVDPGDKCDVQKEVTDPKTGAVIGKGGISRKNLLKLCGNANPNTKGGSSTFLSGAFKIFGLATLEDDVVYPGPNLQAWIDDDMNVISQMIYPNEKRYGGAVGKMYAHEPNMRRFLGQGNVGKKTACSASARKRPDPLADLKGIELVPDEKEYKPDAQYKGPEVDFTKSAPMDPEPQEEQELTADWGDDVEGFEWGDTGDFEWTPVEIPKEEEKKMAANESLNSLNNRLTAAVKTAYRQKCNIDEDMEINDDNFDGFALKAICLKNSWPYADSKQRLFSKETV